MIFAHNNIFFMLRNPSPHKSNQLINYCIINRGGVTNQIEIQLFRPYIHATKSGVKYF